MTTHQPLFRWHLVGLNRVHDAMIRQIAEVAGRRVEHQLGMSCIHEWSCSPEMHFRSDWFDGEYSVVIIQQAALVSALRDLAQSNRMRELHLPVGAASGQIRLIWNWMNASSDTRRWHSLVGVHGVMETVSTVQAWCESVIRNGKRFPVPSHSLLRDLPLPTI